MDAKFTKKCDVYAAGVVFLEGVTLRPPRYLMNTCMPSILGKGLPNCISTSLAADPMDGKLCSELLSILAAGKESVESLSRNPAQFEVFKEYFRTYIRTYDSNVNREYSIQKGTLFQVDMLAQASLPFFTLVKRNCRKSRFTRHQN